MTDPKKEASSAGKPAPDTSVRPGAAGEPAGLERREFLRLGLGGAALLVGCGDGGSGEGGEDASTGTSTGAGEASGTSGGAPTTSGASTGTGGGDGSSSSTGEAGTSTGEAGTSTGEGSSGEGTSTGDDGTTGAVEACEGEIVVFDPEDIAYFPALFPTAVMAGEMKTSSVMIAIVIADAEPKTLRIWRKVGRPGEVDLVHEAMVFPSAEGFMRVTVEGLCPGTWYSYAVFTGAPGAFSSRSLIGEFRTALAEDALEPLTLALAACNGSSLDWPAMAVTADEYYDMFIHLGDMAYNDGATTLAEFRASWRKYLGAEGYKLALARAGLYATWDDHEIDDNSNFDRETMDAQQLAKRQNAFDAYFEALPIDAKGPDYRLWRSFRWGRTAEIIVLDCRYERRPSQQQYISPEQMAFLKDRLKNSPCHFKVIMNSVPITNMPLPWDVAANDRWEGYPGQRKELLDYIDQHDIKNVWFLSGDFHVCFVSRLEPSGAQLSRRTREIAVTSGNQNPIPELLTQLNPTQFDYGVHKARAALVTFDPEADAVHVRFLDPKSGVELYSKSLTQN